MKSALIYPTILIGVAVLSVMVLLVFVVPQFEQTFAQAGKALPLPTQVVIVARHGSCATGGGRSLPIVVLVVLVVRARGSRSPAVRRALGRAAAAHAAARRLVAKVEVARFARTLATLLANGVTLLAGLAIVKETMGNGVLAQRARRRDRAAARRQGLRPAAGRDRPLSEARDADDPGRRGVAAGSRKCSKRVADIYDREVQMAIKRFLAVLEPAMILALAVLIGGIVFSILLGVMGMSELVQ